MTENMTYAGTGVSYDAMDPFKRECQIAARETAENCKRFGLRVVEETYGESVFCLEQFSQNVKQMLTFGHVEEGLGTKNLVADAMYILTGESFYDLTSQDCVAMIVNDSATLGVLPVSVAMHLAVGSSDWFNDEARAHDLVEGWKNACKLARCVWGGGETPTLKDIITPGTFVLSGSAVGVTTKAGRIQDRIEHGDAIVIIESSGIHANGLTMARKIADKLPEGYLTKLSDGRTYGETILDPTHIYVGLVEDCLNAYVDIRYAVNITGHGWRKLMRSTRPFTYVIETLPRQLPIFDFIQEHGPVDDQEAYGNLNMGAGFALYVPKGDVGRVCEIAEKNGLHAFYAGHVEAGKKQVVIEPIYLVFPGETLAVR